jgi:hypothetical protein
MNLFLTRGAIAIAWAAVFAMASDSLTVGIGFLLVLYPLIDVVASLFDAQGQQGSARQLLLAGGVSIIAGVAYITASTTKDPALDMLSLYAAAGGVDFLIEAWLLARRRRRLATVPA